MTAGPKRRAKIVYSAREMQWLEDNRAMIISDYYRAFGSAFGRDDVTAAHLHGLRKRKGWLVGRATGRFKGRRIKYNDAEMDWLHAHSTLPIGEYHRQFLKAFPRDDVTAQNLHALRKREGMKTGRTGRFEKGAVPANKGKKMPFNPRSAATRFKPGQLPHNHQGAGHERVDTKDGYVVMIVDEVNPWTGAATRPVHKHRWLWEQKHGPIPEGFALKCLGDKLNTDPSNWELVPRAMLPRLNGRYGRDFDKAPDQLKPLILAATRLEHAAREKRREASR
tara:strand:- start:157 stop:993 length:837 start_codon:yes stop_codon:yes gene_type:complete